MTAKEKANKLIASFEDVAYYSSDMDYSYKEMSDSCYKNQIKCALILVNEMIEEFHFRSANQDALTYWLGVKKEIELK